MDDAHRIKAIADAIEANLKGIDSIQQRSWLLLKAAFAAGFRSSDLEHALMRWRDDG